MIYRQCSHLTVQTQVEYLQDGRDGCVHSTYTQGEKKSLLLHSAGMNVQDIFFTLAEGEGENIYAKTVVQKYGTIRRRDSGTIYCKTETKS